MNNQVSQQILTIYIRLPDQTGDILNVSSKISILELTDLIRQTQDLQTDFFELYFRQQKLTQLFKTVSQYGVRDQDKIIVQYTSSSFRQDFQPNYFLVLLYNDKKYQLFCDPQKKIYEILIEFFTQFPQNQTSNDQEDYVCYYNEFSLSLQKQLDHYQIQSGAVINVKKIIIQDKVDAIKILNGSCKKAESFYIEKQRNQISDEKNNIIDQNENLAKLKTADILFSGFIQNDSEDEIQISQRSLLQKYIQNPQSQVKINFGHVSPIGFKMENSQQSPFCQIVSNFTDATKKISNQMKQMQIKQVYDSQYTNSLSYIQNEDYSIRVSTQNKQKIQSRMTESKYLPQQQSEYFIDQEALQEKCSNNKEKMDIKQIRNHKCNEIYLAESFDAKDINQTEYRNLIFNPKKYSLTLTSNLTERDYKITFQQKNTIQDIKGIIAACQKVQENRIQLIDSVNKQLYGNGANFKDILTSNIDHLQIKIACQNKQSVII